MTRLSWLVRVMFWAGIVIDAVAAIALVAPADSPFRQLAYPGIIGSQSDYSDGTRSAFPLMLGWTLLLAWGVRQPIERRMVLLLTVPVVVGFIAVELLDVHLGHGTLVETLPTLALQTVMTAGFAMAYVVGDQIAAASTRKVAN